MGVVDLNKENIERVRVLKKTFYEDTKGKQHFVEPAEQKKDKDGNDITKHKELVVGTDLTIQIARKLVQAKKAAIVYGKGQKPKEV